MQSLRSRGYVKEQFCWQWYYWYITNEGIEYLRQYLHLPVEIVPATLKKQPLPQRPGGRPERSDEDRPRRFEDREGGYRKKEGVRGDFKPEFVSSQFTPQDSSAQPLNPSPFLLSF